MEYAPDSEPNTDVRFISSHIPVFTPEENSFPDGPCNLVAAAPKVGRIFVASGGNVKVFNSKTLFEGTSSSALTTISIGAQVTHVATSCDGLTLLVAIIHNQVPHALFYEIRSLVPGCGEQNPLVSVALAGPGGQVHALAWNPMDPSSVAVAVAPSSLILLTLRDNQVESKSENIQARALGWSPKGKQLTVGVEDGTLKLFKPDLTAVRSIQRPPMNEAGAVLSITWFTNTEFFIGYKNSVEEGAHVIMYVNAPKGKEPRFVADEYVCNYNQGPRAAMLYPFFFLDWSLLCVLSSRAVAMAVLGRPAAGGDGWCEYEIDEGFAAAVQNVSITEETFPLGLAVDFTSQKTFTAKDNKVSGPCPVLCTLSTGGQLNLFHMINEKSGAQTLTKPQENLPMTGLRTPQQFGGVASYSVGKPAVPVPSWSTGTTDTRGVFPSTPTPVASSALPAPQKVGTFSFTTPSQAPSFTTPSQAPSFTTPSQASSFTTPSQASSFSSPAQTSSFSSISASPLQSLKTSLKLPQTQPSPLTTSLFPKTQPASTSMFNLQGTVEGTKPAPAPPSSTQSLPQASISLDFKIPSAPLTQLSTPAVTSSSVVVPDIKPQPTVGLKPPEMKPQSVATPPKPPAAVATELNDTLLSTIEAAKIGFERELEDHMNMGDLPNQVGGQEEMCRLRCSLGETLEWVNEMRSTTSELKGEVGQLHSEVLEGFVLAEEAEARVIKSKNPRHCLMLQPQTLDPHSRKQMEEIRSLYQYLQSQMAEIDTRLHLDWAAYRNEQNKKKKKELPASETLYQALKKCHYARKVCERQVDTLCERIKDLHLHSLSGLAAPQTHQEDDEILATIERSLRETSISSPPRTSPFKMLSPRKQESLQKVLSQRNFIPLRKCSHVPRMNLSSLEDFSPGHSQEPSPRSSFTTNKGHSLLDSFGPQTFSTPVRNNQIPVTPQARSTSEVSAVPESEAVPALVPQPQYEDITPPQTPDNRSAQGTKPASPLRALSRLVSEVPTTVASDTKVPGAALLAEGKTTFLSFSDGGSCGGLKAPVTVTSGLVQGAFKPVTSAPLSTTTLAFSLAQFAPPSLASQNSGTQQSLSQNVVGGSSLLFKPPTTASENNSFSHATNSEVLQKTEVKSNFFFKPPVSVSDAFNQFSGKLETSSAPQDKLLSAPEPSTSQPQNVSKARGSCSAFGVMASPQGITTPHLASVAEIDSTSSSSSADSDTASNTTVILDNASISGASNFTEGSDQPAERVGDTGIIEVPSLVPPHSTSQSSLFTANSGNLFGGSSSGSMFGVSTSSSSFFGTKTSAGSSLLSSSTTTTTSTTSTPVPSSANLFGTLASPSTIASGAVLSAPTTTAGSLFGAQATSSGKVLLGTDTSAKITIATTVTSGSLFGKTSAPTTTTTTENKLETAAPTSSGSIFGTTKVSTGGTLFGTLSSGNMFGTASTSTPSGSIFGMTGNATGSIFGAATPTTAATTTVTVTTTAASIFGGSGASTASAGILGTALTANSGAQTTTTIPPPLPTTTTTLNESVFGVATTATDSIFGKSTGAISSTAGGGIFGGKTTAEGIFGGTSTSGNLFGTTTSASTGSLFGTTSTSTASGNNFVSPATTSSIFGAPAQTSATTQPIFGSTASSAGNTSNLFEGNSSVSVATTSVSIITTAASTSTPASSSPQDLTTGLFSSPPAGESPAFSLSFTTGGSSGSATPAISATPTLFSTQAATTASGAPFSPGGIFSASTTTSTSAFTSLTTSSSAFTSPASSAPSLTPSTSASASTAGTVFGQATPGLVFGNTASQSSPFGGGGQTTGTFGTSQPSGSIFGGSGGQSLFGNTSGSMFGQTSAANTSPFSPVSTSKSESSLFGGSSAFGSGGGGGGGFFSGLGSKPSTENANKNVFGGGTLSSPAPQTGLFGNSSSSSSSPFQGSVFGGGASSSGGGGGGGGTFTGGGGPVANAGFAVTTPQSPGAFGGSPTFGGSPSFGGAPTFGSPPVFGGSSTFSSPLSPSTGGGFSTFASSGNSTFGTIAGSSSSPSSGFGSFANQGNAASFGSLAQQTTDQQTGAFGSGGGGAFGSGSNFSAWR